ncbi:MAG: adenylate/guanylate cyclase domain-containing protein [Methylovulum miyakonense]|uniref:CHASE2 domain-containing protein n=1 Tax=Methylovulum miyakonense TaxID=645578 RepID=UPI003BB6FF1D
MKRALPAFKHFLSLPRFFIASSKLFLLSALAGILGSILCLTPLGLYLEEEFGLAWLFAARGAIAPPEDVVIISADITSAEILHLPDDPKNWPREYYARLINQLNLQQPSIIALNIVFNENRGEQGDRQLAEAIAQNHNVILSNYLKHKIIPMSGSADAVSFESVIESIDTITSAALGTAPFLIPKTSSTVKQFWMNKTSAGDLRTFPDLVFQCHIFKAAYPEIITLLQSVNPTLAAKLPDSFTELASEHGVIETIERIHSAFTKLNSVEGKLEQLIAAAQFPAKQQHLLGSWLKVMDGQKSLYLNHYGNIGAIKTIPFYQAFEHLPPETLRGKVVMVGLSENIEPEKNLGFYTFFSDANGQTSSPIEIAATAVANLIDNTWLKPLDVAQQLLMLLAWGILLTAVCLACPFRPAMVLVMLLSGAYVYSAYYGFTTAQIWLPLIIPIGMQMPMIVTAAAIMHFRQTHQAKFKMQLVLRHLLPKEIVDNIPNQPENRVMATSGKLMQGVCMATDINDYTKLSETTPPSILIELMNAYYSAIFPLVNDHGGYITDLAGDGMYAVWLNPENRKQMHINACQAALAIKSTIQHFNQTQHLPLITRFGLACGEISIGHTGAPGRYVYRAIGDPVNTASRIEGLNKYLGTQILVTAEVVDDLTGFFLRDLGLFKLKGKAKSVHVFELMMTMGQANARAHALASAFANALMCFQAKQWATALATFIAISKDFPEDGPTLFFIRHLQSLTALPETAPHETPALIDISPITF